MRHLRSAWKMASEHKKTCVKLFLFSPSTFFFVVLPKVYIMLLVHIDALLDRMENGVYIFVQTKHTLFFFSSKRPTEGDTPQVRDRRHKKDGTSVGITVFVIVVCKGSRLWCVKIET